MEERDPTCLTPGAASYREGKVLPGNQAGSIREFLQRMPLGQVKQEPDEALLQHWEAQWQDFLKKMESPQYDWGILQPSEETTPWVDTKGFLASFEQVAEACRWPKAEWAARLLPALSGEAEQAFISLEGRDREDYGKVKAAILRGDAIGREKLRQHFRRFCYQEAEGPRGVYSRLQELCRRWLKVERHSKEQILEVLILEQFLAILPSEIQNWVRERGPETCGQAVVLAEDFLHMQQEAAKRERQVAEEEGVTANPSEVGRALPDLKQKPLCAETKQEEDGGEAGLLGGQGWLTADVGEAYPPEDSQRAGPRGFAPASAEGAILLGCRQEKASGSQHRAEFQQETRPEEKVAGSAPYGDGYADFGGTAVHQRIHTGKRHNAYGAYGNNFARSSSSATYKRMRQGGKSHVCLVCGKCFLYSSGLATHQRIHTGEKPYVCAECGRTFVCSSDRNRHQRTHTEETPYECAECGKRFRQRFSLSRHRRTHAGERPYPCSGGRGNSVVT
ncbi:zinc finger and SCAN domain-containing protein 31-like [Elgaria multicarinata webbii]|uniref:zinc finger and SCAN domain-containing protein 31-like n=1 Tax=Elgaria multicarinata webbii TaxID=159646 RepID=UPI002FCD2D33